MPNVFDQLVEWGPPYLALGVLIFGIWKAAKWVGAVLFNPETDDEKGGLITRWMTKQEAFLDQSMASQRQILALLGEQSTAISVVERRIYEISARTSNEGEANALIEIFMNDLPVPLSQVGEDGTFVRTNQALQTLLGYTAEELAGMKFHDVTEEPDDLEADIEASDRVRSGDLESYRMEKTYHRKNGTGIYCALYVFRFPVRGRFRFFVSCILPLSDSHSLR